MDGGSEAGISERDGGSEQPSIARFLLNRRVFLGAIVVLLVIGVLLVTTRATTSVVIPDLVGERVDPQLDRLRLRLAYEGLVLNNVSTATCPIVLLGTIIDQNPAAGVKVVVSRAVDVTVCLPA
jgi:beta-lactam-binding protein with PASTA domain